MLKKYYPTIALITIIVTIALIFIGGLVRATGAGLGCPDWPKCFGLWIPPTNVADLPAQFNPDDFNVVKTWTEYINRLVGVLVGFLIILTAVFSAPYRKINKKVTYFSVASLILVLFQGWLGGQVVRSGLQQGIITLHMFIAMLILSTLIIGYYYATEQRYSVTFKPDLKKLFNYLLYPLFIVTFLQILLGTQVREAIDQVNQTIDRSLWLDQVGLIDDIHRTFSWAVLILSGLVVYFVRKNNIKDTFSKAANYTLGFVLLQVLSGIVLAYGGFPASFQVIHLGLAAFMIVSIVIMILLVKSKA